MSRSGMLGLAAWVAIVGSVVSTVGLGGGSMAIFAQATYHDGVPDHPDLDRVASWMLYAAPVVLVLGAALGFALGALAARAARLGGGSQQIGLAAMAAGLLVVVLPVVAAVVFGIYAMLTFAGPHGRPLRVGGRPIVGRTRRGRSWSSAIVPCLDGVDGEIRAALAAAWRQDARLEHASIAAFARLSCDLLAAGAPPSLVERAHRAASDEIEHARACFALASAYAGHDEEPAPFPDARRGVVSLSRTALLEMLVHESVIDGCVGERMAAITASRGARRAVDPVVADVLTTIARDESEHAALADAVVDWATGELGPSARRIEAALAEVEATEVVVDLRLREHGRPDADDLRSARAEAISQARARWLVRAAA